MIYLEATDSADGEQIERCRATDQSSTLTTVTPDQLHPNVRQLMSSAEKFIVLPYKKTRGNLVPGEMRQASSAPSAEKIAAAMAGRFVGVAAYSVMVDEETGDMTSPKLLAQHGEIADLNPA